jgi:hypothetical protein
VLAGAATTAAAVTVGVHSSSWAQGADADLATFVTLSAALTGVAKSRLAPESDPVGIGGDYFKWVMDKQPNAFASLLQIAKSANLQIPDASTGGIIKQDDVDKLVKQIEARDDTKFLARSVVLMWYLGSWYEPNDLKSLTLPNPPRFISHTVISPKAYTQGWLWRVAQAHPMGYSELQFGYWNRQPQPIEDFIAARAHGKGA